jgi:hypothetical protein
LIERRLYDEAFVDTLLQRHAECLKARGAHRWLLAVQVDDRFYAPEDVTLIYENNEAPPNERRGSDD